MKDYFPKDTLRNSSANNNKTTIVIITVMTTPKKRIHIETQANIASS